MLPRMHGRYMSSPCNTPLAESTLVSCVTRNPSSDDPQMTIVLTARTDAATIGGTRIKNRSQGNISTYHTQEIR